MTWNALVFNGECCSTHFYRILRRCSRVLRLGDILANEGFSRWMYLRHVEKMHINAGNEERVVSSFFKVLNYITQFSVNSWQHWWRTTPSHFQQLIASQQFSCQTVIFIIAFTSLVYCPFSYSYLFLYQNDSLKWRPDYIRDFFHKRNVFVFLLLLYFHT